MTTLDEQRLQAGFDKYPKPDFHFAYGTAGFRARADILGNVCFRMGVIAALRSVSLHGRAVGLMITASHNPEQDNGIKMVDAEGEMLAAEWEPICTRIVNAESVDLLQQEIHHAVESMQIDLKASSPHVICGYDTRPSALALTKAAEDGLHVLGAHIFNAGLVTTPQLHFLVMESNMKNLELPLDAPPTVDMYYERLASSFVKFLAGTPFPVPIVIDCANGVGAHAIQNLTKMLPEGLVDITLLRTSMHEQGKLNHACGADFVKSKQCLPDGYENEPTVQPGSLLCSFDGDADRIVFYYVTGPVRDPASFHLLDGDKIATLATDFISELVREARLDITVGCVQTAYANGASTAYLTQQHVPVTCTKTGVKHLHHAAKEYDIGVYFEANGHGTVLFSPRAMVAMGLTSSSNEASPSSTEALDRLRLLTVLINQTVGDALSDMLLVLVILAARRWGAAEWDNCYSDLPNRLTKVSVPDRTLFTTTDAERRLSSPVGLQDKIDELVQRTPQGRSFVRPSGTEDCVRVYAEAETSEDAERLAQAVEHLVKTAA